MNIETLEKIDKQILPSDIFEHTVVHRYVSKSGIEFHVNDEYKNILDFIESIGKCFVAGGAFKHMLINSDSELLMRNNRIHGSPRDYDVYFDTYMDFGKYNEYCKKNYNLMYENDNCICYRIHRTKITTLEVKYGFGFIDVELIKVKDYKSFAKKLNSFDFRVCKIFYEGGEFKGVDGAFECLVNRKLKVDSVKNPIGTMNRVIKYDTYGFEISNSDLIKLSFCVLFDLIKNAGKGNLYKRIKSLSNIRNTYI